MHDGNRSPFTDPPLTDVCRPLAALSDNDLLRCLAEILSQSRRVERDLVAHIGEVDARRLYAREAFPSMFAYCTGALHLSEGEAYLRIAVARASREHPILLAMLGDGRLHLSGIAQLAPHLTAENREALLSRATHRSKRQIEELIAEVAPREDVPALIRKLPDRRGLPAGDHLPAGDRFRPAISASGGRSHSGRRRFRPAITSLRVMTSRTRWPACRTTGVRGRGARATGLPRTANSVRNG